ncbi:helix-turn-helix domain-containing protein [Amphritea sp. ZJ14W]|uniref:Helix-turn-helix domain-containing protein n=2 Tax=Amphritea TaxID=515417 RepID=A0ABS2W7V6_9GAMM|nr:helix-turn-helix domain-containing protein [Amphritea pacifica]MBN1009020.1 helix-turn-helix domain-containing protein [Amphritea pacifica]
MKDELFADLLSSAEEMVAIEKGEIIPDSGVVHHYETLDVKAIREASGKSRKEFADIIGASYEAVKSWENKRRNPTGPTKKLLTLVRENPRQMVAILEQESA